MSKYRNRKTEVNGIKFDSATEARRYEQLIALERAHIISDLILQPKFLLQESFRKCPECGCMPEKGKKCLNCQSETRLFRARHYVADFQYRDKKTGKTVIEDVKGRFQTEVFKLKWAWFEGKYPDKSLKIVVMKPEPRKTKKQAALLTIPKTRRVKA